MVWCTLENYDDSTEEDDDEDFSLKLNSKCGSKRKALEDKDLQPTRK